MELRWNTQATLDLLLNLYGKPQYVLASASLRSIIHRQEYALVHYQDVTSLVGAYIAANLSDKSLLRVSLGGNDVQRKAFNELMVRVGAYTTALVQSLHAMPDILGHAIYYTLAMNRDPEPLGERAISARSVLRRLSGPPELQTLHDLFAEFFQGGDFAHLNALANTAKHRSIVRASLNEDQTGTRAARHLVMLEAVEYDGRSYPAVAVTDLPVNEYDRLFPLTCVSGIH
jgi:hypothetical protein